MYGLDATPLSIEAAWEHSQHQQHTLNHPQHVHHRLETPSSNQNFQFGYSAAFPQYTIPPVSPSSSSVTSSSSSSSSVSLPSPTTPLGLSSADLLMRRSFGFNVNGGDAQGINVPACLPTHQLFDFDFSASLEGQEAHAPPSPSSSIDSATLVSPTSPSMASVPSSITFPSPNITDNDSNTSCPPKRSSASTAPSTGGSKKPRACMSTKDFVPPDVTGLSKREARLVKNRAAAFLSRQRKREEFELMEIRVSELEQENARMKAVIEGRSPPPISSSSSDRASSSPAPSPSNEADQLRAQLAAARQRENDLAERLERIKYQAQQAAREQAKEREELERLRNELGLDKRNIIVKEEENDSTSSRDSTPLMGPVKNLINNPKSGASLGLMVLLCALPSLLSSNSPSTSTLPTSSSFIDVHTAQATGFDTQPVMPSASSEAANALDWEFDWAGRPRSRPASSPSTMDIDPSSAAEETPGWKKLEFEADDAREIFGLGALDVSFHTQHTNDGKIRVRVHSSDSQNPTSDSVDLALPASPEESGVSDDPLGPFLASASTQGHAPSLLSGINLGFNGMHHLGMNLGSMGMSDFGFGTEFSFTSPGTGLPASTPPSSGLHAIAGTKGNNILRGSRKRVRIALKSLPTHGGEGGEWEVEIQ